MPIAWNSFSEPVNSSRVLAPRIFNTVKSEFKLSAVQQLSFAGNNTVEPLVPAILCSKII